MVYTLLFFASKCSLFHNSNVFGSCIIHILYTGCAKIKQIILAPKGLSCTQKQPLCEDVVMFACVSDTVVCLCADPLHPLIHVSLCGQDV